MIPIQLDLHGKTQNEAIKYLETQLSILKMRGETMVIVITGRGHGSKQGVDKGTLKIKVPVWLNGSKFSSIVDKVVTSPVNSGMLMVWLKHKPNPPYLKLAK